MAQAASLRFSERLGYGLGDTASNFFFQTFNIFLLYYYTDIFGIPAGFVGTMFLVSRIWDAVNDPLMGIIADRTSTRWGKYRPYLLFFAIPYGLVGFLMFANPDLDLTGRMVYAAVTYTAMMMVYTAINIPYAALMAVMTPSSAERTTLSTFRFVGAFGGGMLVTAMVLPLKDALGGGDEATGFRYTMALFGVISIALFCCTFFLTKERLKPTPRSKGSLGKDLSDLMGNRPWLVMVAAAVFTMTNVAIRNGATVYFFKYYLEDEAAASLFMTVGMGAMVLGVMSTKFFTQRWDKRTLMIWLNAANALCILLFFFIPSDQLVLMYVVNIVGTFLAGPTPALVWAMYSDVADYSEWKYGRRATALIFSAAQFAQKAGLTIGGFCSGWLLEGFGFVANAAQTGTALLGIRLMYSVIPAIFAGANALVMILYPLTEDKVRQIETELQDLRDNHPDPQPLTAAAS
ncbi:MAG: glycoside/pentoside/hexuronide:cation symporter GPH family [Puniceicoccaceae bacterium 5H]|nr:MAG: glycoside/pentoside/hexuronide:cation symporter GPH family [Puniceicoccaceae bacterium 5H]